MRHDLAANGESMRPVSINRQMQCMRRLRWRSVGAAIIALCVFTLVAAAQPKPPKHQTEDLEQMAKGLLAEDPTKPPAATPAPEPPVVPPEPEPPVLPPEPEVVAPPVAAPPVAPPPTAIEKPAKPIKALALVKPRAIKPHRGSSKARKARIESGANVELKGPTDSPLAKIGLPPAAVPVVAAATTAAAIGLWPLLLKTLLGLLKGVGKGVVADYFKKRAKKGQKVKAERRFFLMLGLRIRPAELGHVAAGALVYGGAVYYAMFGIKLDSPVLARQEALVLMFYGVRSLVRFTYEQAYGIVTEFRFWPTGSLLSLGSAYLGNTLSLVGYELSTAKTPTEEARLVKMSASVISIAVALASMFYALNSIHPTVFFQSGLLACSGSALSDILPVKPLTGYKIWSYDKRLWAGLFVVIAPLFVFVNFML
jgi:hypothetical protein